MSEIERELDICVLTGGTSSEREVSLKSGERVYRALEEGSAELNPFRGEFSEEEDLLDLVVGSDLVFNALHGGIGEDGTVQALLDLLEIPYTGTGPLGSAIAMNKLASKKAFHRASVRTPAFRAKRGTSFEKLVQRVDGEFSYPVMVKPAKEGSSRGISIADDREDLYEKLRETEENYGEVFAEEMIDGKEVTAGVLRHDGELKALPLVEIRVKGERFFNYRAKYTPGETEFIVPAEVPDDLAHEVKDRALRSHEEFGCRGYSRVDFIIGDKGGVYGLEVNTLPGMTEMSDLPLAAQEAGIGFPDLVGEMIENVVEMNDIRR
ncbi:MAG: D-alanine--D-alanine ligase [Candidatus Acetothermia bacterium]